MTSPNPTLAAIARIRADVEEAERAFAGQPKAVWTTRTYLSPASAKAARTLIQALALRPLVVGDEQQAGQP
jgi:hypothetical protein